MFLWYYQKNEMFCLYIIIRYCPLALFTAVKSIFSSFFHLKQKSPKDNYIWNEWCLSQNQVYHFSYKSRLRFICCCTCLFLLRVYWVKQLGVDRKWISVFINKLVIFPNRCFVFKYPTSFVWLTSLKCT